MNTFTKNRKLTIQEYNRLFRCAVEQRNDPVTFAQLQAELQDILRVACGVKIERSAS